MFQSIFQALAEKRFFKLICGGSFTDQAYLRDLIGVYAQTSLSMIDVSASLEVVQTALSVLESIENAPPLMVSFPLDDDPHFRKIGFIETSCIDCGVCVPVCPTQVFSLPEAENLTLEVPRCYGCGRCVPVCPTDALHLEPFTLYPDLVPVLSMPQVKAVEIHTTYADPAMVDPLFQELGPYLKDKLISLCFRPQTLPIDQIVAFIHRFKTLSTFPLILQIDGDPMSGSENPMASIPALEAAREFLPFCPSDCYMTISGGINAETALYLKNNPYEGIQGVGMGTYARQAVWADLDDPKRAHQIAESLVKSFQGGTISDIISMGTYSN